jgi:aminoglycoside phosphotransferase (APT) family kinase protein
LDAVEPATDLVVAHGDFGSHNFVFDPVSHEVTGVFDFENACFADRHLDLQYWPSYGEPILAMAMAEYEARSGARLSVPRVRLYHAITAMAFLAWRAEEPAAHDARSGRNLAQALAWVEQAVDSVE